MLTLYNTLIRKKEEFTPITEGKVTFYHCGPTVYWTQHIGNLRGTTMADLVVRTLRYIGYDVTHVRNYTDVGHLTSDSDTGEDKMEKGAKREGKTPNEIADTYIARFEKDTKAINLLEPTFSPRATSCIEEMKEMVSELLTNGHAYETDLAVYFDTTTFPDYTKLSRQKSENQEAGAGKADVSDPRKRHSSDFALWFFRTGVHRNALQYWPSPFHSSLVSDGIGFPGWHIECSAMARKFLGKTIDIHMGGIEHIPVHHTNEIAQSECANGTPFAHYWLHNGHLWVDGKKMAKSEGASYVLDDIINKGFDPLALRYFFLTAQYRSMQNFTWEALEASAKAFNDLRGLMANWKQEKERTQLSEEKIEKIDGYRRMFTGALDNDINVPGALAVVWEVAKSNVPSPDKYDLLIDFDQVLGLRLDEEHIKQNEQLGIPEAIQALVNKRDAFRREKKFTEADTIRKEIEEQGYILKDTSSGTVVRFSS